jgi:hypothetical protein
VSLGAYPSISLKEARARATALRSQLNHGVSPKPSWRQDTESAEKPTPAKTLFKDYAAECDSRTPSSATCRSMRLT